MAKSRYQKHSPGNALAEYALVSTLIAGVVGVSAMMTLGNTLTDIFGNLAASTGRSATVQVASDIPPGSTTQATEVPPASQDPVPPAALNTLPPNYSASDINQSVFTTGANGTIEMLGLTMSSLADEKLASGEITAEEANLLKALANQGYRMSSVAKLLEDAATACGSDSTCYLNAKVTYDGQEYMVYDLKNKLADPRQHPDASAEEAKQFLALWEQVQASGLLQDAETLDFVNQMSKDVMRTANMLQWSVSDSLNGTSTPDQLTNDLLAKMGAEVPTTASDQISTDSSGICTAGDGTSTDSTCQ